MNSLRQKLFIHLLLLLSRVSVAGQDTRTEVAGIPINADESHFGHKIQNWITQVTTTCLFAKRANQLFLF